jgi:uncharacterized membrane protein
MNSSELEIHQQQTYQRLGLATMALCVIVTAMAFLIPAHASNEVLRFEPWHAAITAILLFWGARAGRTVRHLAGLAVFAGMLYLAPTAFLFGLVFLVPLGDESDQVRFNMSLVYFSLLVAYYGVALVFLRRANPAARQAVAQRD